MEFSNLKHMNSRGQTLSNQNEAMNFQLYFFFKTCTIQKHFLSAKNLPQNVYILYFTFFNRRTDAKFLENNSRTWNIKIRF